MPVLMGRKAPKHMGQRLRLLMLSRACLEQGSETPEPDNTPQPDYTPQIDKLLERIDAARQKLQECCPTDKKKRGQLEGDLEALTKQRVELMVLRLRQWDPP